MRPIRRPSLVVVAVALAAGLGGCESEPASRDDVRVDETRTDEVRVDEKRVDEPVNKPEKSWWE